jgi:hypothetical protein
MQRERAILRVRRCWWMRARACNWKNYPVCYVICGAIILSFSFTLRRMRTRCCAATARHAARTHSGAIIPFAKACSTNAR